MTVERGRRILEIAKDGRESLTTRAEATPGRARKLRRGPLTRKQILDASLRLFSDKGFARTSVRDIAQAAGITDAAIYYHFSSKRELFEALLEERGFTPALSELERANVQAPAAEVILRICLGALNIMYRNRDVMKVLLMEAMGEDPIAAEEYRMLADRWQRGQARVLDILVERGELRPMDSAQVSQDLMLLTVACFTDYLMSLPSRRTRGTDGPPEELVERVRHATSTILRGILT